MGIQGLQKAALIIVLTVGFFLGWFFGGVVGAVNGFVARLTPPSGEGVPAQASTGHEVKVGNSVLFSP